MKKDYRIKKNEEFSEIISHKKSISNATFVFYLGEKKEEHARVGLSVSKKLGNAVIRNKIKRQIRMMFLEIFDFEKYPYDVICIARNKYLAQSYDSNEVELEKLVKKAIID